MRKRTAGELEIDLRNLKNALIGKEKSQYLQSDVLEWISRFLQSSMWLSFDGPLNHLSFVFPDYTWKFIEYPGEVNREQWLRSSLQNVDFFWPIDEEAGADWWVVAVLKDKKGHLPICGSANLVEMLKEIPDSVETPLGQICPRIHTVLREILRFRANN